MSRAIRAMLIKHIRARLQSMQGNHRPRLPASSCRSRSRTREADRGKCMRVSRIADQTTTREAIGAKHSVWIGKGLASSWSAIMTITWIIWRLWRRVRGTTFHLIQIKQWPWWPSEQELQVSVNPWRQRREIISFWRSTATSSSLSIYLIWLGPVWRGSGNCRIIKGSQSIPCHKAEPTGILAMKEIFRVLSSMRWWLQRRVIHPAMRARAGDLYLLRWLEISPTLCITLRLNNSLALFGPLQVNQHPHLTFQHSLNLLKITCSRIHSPTRPCTPPPKRSLNHYNSLQISSNNSKTLQ